MAANPGFLPERPERPEGHGGRRPARRRARPDPRRRAGPITRCHPDPGTRPDRPHIAGRIPRSIHGRHNTALRKHRGTPLRSAPKKTRMRSSQSTRRLAFCNRLQVVSTFRDDFMHKVCRITEWPSRWPDGVHPEDPPAPKGTCAHGGQFRPRGAPFRHGPTDSRWFGRAAAGDPRPAVGVLTGILIGNHEDVREQRTLSTASGRQRARRPGRTAGRTASDGPRRNTGSVIHPTIAKPRDRRLGNADPAGRRRPRRISVGDVRFTPGCGAGRPPESGGGGPVLPNRGVLIRSASEGHRSVRRPDTARPTERNRRPAHSYLNSPEPRHRSVGSRAQPDITLPFPGPPVTISELIIDCICAARSRAAPRSFPDPACARPLDLSYTPPDTHHAGRRKRRTVRSGVPTRHR